MLLECRRKLRADGRLVILVPGPNAFGSWNYRAGDADHHLWAWDSQLLGNLLESAGYEVESSKLIPYTHSPHLYATLPEHEWLRRVQKQNRHPNLVAVARPKRCQGATGAQ